MRRGAHGPEGPSVVLPGFRIRRLCNSGLRGTRIVRYRNALAEVTDLKFGNATKPVSLQENAEKNIDFVRRVRRMQVNLNRKARFVVPGHKFYQVVSGVLLCLPEAQESGESAVTPGGQSTKW